MWLEKPFWGLFLAAVVSPFWVCFGQALGNSFSAPLPEVGRVCAHGEWTCRALGEPVYLLVFHLIFPRNAASSRRPHCTIEEAETENAATS